jgi:DNA processing protein
MDRQTVLDWLRLIKIPGLGPVGIDNLLQHFGPPEAILEASESNLAEVPGISSPMVAALKDFRKEIPQDHMVNQLDQLAKIGGKVLIRGSDDYPQILTTIHDPPPVLFLLGDPSRLNNAQAVAVVGSRRASRSGISFAYNLAQDLAKNRITTVSGLALGIDTAAHEGALMGQGPTIAVIATGLDVDYPPGNRDLKKRILESGCMITEAPLGTQAAPYLFPPRNRIISGLSRGVVVVEATTRSGSLITARMALEQGREVFAVPGSASSGDTRAKGVNNLIRQGARVVEGIEDILQELSWSVESQSVQADSIIKTQQPSNFKNPAKNRENGSILTHLEAGPLSADELARECQLTVASLSRILLQLELTGVVERLAGNRYALLRNNSLNLHS